MQLLVVSSLVLLMISLVASWSYEVEDFKTPLNCYMPCPFVVDPVCATNGTAYFSFNNMCFLKAENCAYNAGWREVDSLYCKQKTKKSETDCNKRCDHHASPICCFDGNLYKLFWNNCLKRQEECIDGRKWEEVPLVNCVHNSTCADVCPGHAKHVCASNGETYRWLRNPCVMDLENCRLSMNKSADKSKVWREVPSCKCVYKSETILKYKCEVKCKSVYTPVCASNGSTKKTFVNVCAMTVHNCLNCSNFTTLYPGVCE